MTEQHGFEEEQKLTIEEGEALAATELAEVLDPYILEIQQTINVISSAVNMTPTMEFNDVSISFKVVNSLLMKSINDLRVIWLLSMNGYSTQSATVASSLYESTFSLAYIGNNDHLAQKWNAHSNQRSLPLGTVKDITKGAIKKQFPENFESISDIEYTKYSQLCMAKHGNPIIQKRHVYKYEGHTFIADAGPETSDHSKRLTCSVIGSSIGFAIYALVSYVNEHLDSYITPKLIAEFDALRKYHLELCDQFLAKWE